MGDFAVLQEIHLTVPEVILVGTSHREIEKNYKNCLTPLGSESITYQFQSHNLDQPLRHLLLAQYLAFVCIIQGISKLTRVTTLKSGGKNLEIIGISLFLPYMLELNPVSLFICVTTDNV